MGRMRNAAGALALLAALAAGCASTDGVRPGAVRTGAIEGRVRLGDGADTGARHTVVTAWPEGAPAPLPTRPRPRELVAAQIAAGRFAPGTLVVAAGTSVVFDNRDHVFHVPFSITPGGAFELGRCAPGTRHSVDFDHPGVVEVFCALHPAEHMYVVVSPDRWHARPEPDGRFAFHNLPLGTWFVRVWNPTRGEVTKRVEVAGAAPVVVDLEP